MSDIADRASWRIEQDVKNARAHISKQPALDSELRDTMPSLAKITNGAGIDLNPGFSKAFKVHQPFMLKNVEWEWTDNLP